MISVGVFGEDRLLAAGCVRLVRQDPVITGWVDPEHRGRGLGAELLDRLLQLARGRGARVSVETESLTPDADALFVSRGLRQSFAEDVMRLDLHALPPAAIPAGITVQPWEEDTRHLFFQAYQRSFADRPGFPGWSQQQWIDWTVDDAFRPHCSLVARRHDGDPLGFVTCAQGFLIQIGTLPARRGQGIGQMLALAALERLRASGDTHVLLDINVNNPASAALFSGLGFTPIARRARYE
ncbi:GNAT family N-acetyltransferase [Nonomuraea sp. NPDC023979]|uniref:GNAT family N-acetyltransferase n=1 Tax=Nonomuraea sp. NPDC023979 TaxID=3154796 RepID=UPI0033C8CE0C